MGNFAGNLNLGKRDLSPYSPGPGYSRREVAEHTFGELLWNLL